MSTTATAPAAKTSVVDTIKGCYAAVVSFFVARYTWVKSKLPTKTQAAYGLVACALLFGFLAYMGSQDTSAPSEIVENARQAWAPLASADDGVSKASVYARDGVDRGFDWVMAKIGL
jgi:hypothetical protein